MYVMPMMSISQHVEITTKEADITDFVEITSI
jgi:hypothetical protein